MNIYLFFFLGEMETDEPDEESSQDQELPSENENSQSEDSVGCDNDLENGVVPENPSKGQTSQRKRLFTFQFNNMGKTDPNFIKGESRQIRFHEDHMRLSGKNLHLPCSYWSHVLWRHHPGTQYSHLSKPEMREKFLEWQPIYTGLPVHDGIFST